LIDTIITRTQIRARPNITNRGVTKGWQGGCNSPGVESLWGRQIIAGAEWLLGAPKSPSSVTSTFFNTAHLLPKDLSFEHGAPNLLLAPGAIWPGYAHDRKIMKAELGRLLPRKLAAKLELLIVFLAEVCDRMI